MIGIIDYKAGNIGSVKNALDRLKVKYFLSNDSKKLEKADKLIFPGVGSARYAMKELQKYELDKFLKSTKQPILGICLGLQLLYDFSEEGSQKCLEVIRGTVNKFESDKLCVPQIGWNKVRIKKDPLFNGISDNSYFYFVHSYFAPVTEETIGTTTYGIDFSAVIKKDNIYAVQFHPEKSGEIGEKLLQNYINLNL